MKEVSQADYEAASDFRDTFSQLLVDNLTEQTTKQLGVLKASQIDTPLGPMIAIADEKFLYLLEFFVTRGLDRELERLRQRGFALAPGNTPALTSIKNELNHYFEGRLKVFKTPYRVAGSSFQQAAWKALCQIPYGELRSYAEQSALLGKPKAYRAVGNANGANQFAIIIPCHRVIASDGSLGGYAGGLTIKEGLINHEKRYRTKS